MRNLLLPSWQKERFGFDVDAERIQKRLDTRYLDEVADSIEDGNRQGSSIQRRRHCQVYGVVINAADGLEALIEKGIVPDVLTDQTSAHDPIDGYVPRGMSLDEACISSGQ